MILMIVIQANDNNNARNELVVIIILGLARLASTICMDEEATFGSSTPIGSPCYY